MRLLESAFPTVDHRENADDARPTQNRVFLSRSDQNMSLLDHHQQIWSAMLPLTFVDKLITLVAI